MLLEIYFDSDGINLIEEVLVSLEIHMALCFGVDKRAVPKLNCHNDGVVSVEFLKNATKEETDFYISENVRINNIINNKIIKLKTKLMEKFSVTRK